MKVFICRWQNGNLSIVGARDPEDAISILDELGDATDAELFETKNLLIDFELDDNGHLELQQFGEELDGLILEKAYPLLLQARMNNDDDETDFPEAAEAERERLWPKDEVRETEHFARNLFVARVASDRKISLASALKKIKTENLTLNESWHSLAAKCQALNSVQFGEHIASMLEPADEDGPDRSLRMSSVPDAELKPYDENDLLPHFLLAAVIAEHARASILMAWPYVRPHLKEEIGTFWRWLAQEVRAIPTF